jgi:hypothetical protein
LVEFVKTNQEERNRCCILAWLCYLKRTHKELCPKAFIIVRAYNAVANFWLCQRPQLKTIYLVFLRPLLPFPALRTFLNKKNRAIHYLSNKKQRNEVSILLDSKLLPFLVWKRQPKERLSEESLSKWYDGHFDFTCLPDTVNSRHYWSEGLWRGSIDSIPQRALGKE